jgi:hypothetical protein
MLDIEFLEQVADYYGSFSLDEFAERLGVSSVELLEEIEHLVEDSEDALREEMGMESEEDEDD